MKKLNYFSVSLVFCWGLLLFSVPIIGPTSVTASPDAGGDLRKDTKKQIEDLEREIKNLEKYMGFLEKDISKVLEV